MYDGKDIAEHNAARRLNILKSFVDDENSFEKANSNLNKKQITDKNGVPTTRWVKPEEQDAEQNQSVQNNQSLDTNPSMKTSEEHAKETSSEDLQTYIANNPDGEHVSAAKAELAARGEGEEVATGQAEEGATYQEGEGYSGTEGGVNFDDPNSVIEGIEQNRDAIIALMQDDPTLSAIHALKMVVSGGGNNSEAHGALDAAQAALDAAKTATGHPGAKSELNNFDDNFIESVFSDPENDFDPNSLTEEEFNDFLNACSLYASNEANEYSKEVSNWLNDGESEEQNGESKNSFDSDNDKKDPDGSDVEGEEKEESVDEGEDQMQKEDATDAAQGGDDEDMKNTKTKRKNNL